ncbi:hypothetical protein [Devosia nitrariae]|uniref:Uncharacterized protein n=1 Tax=Devosia nitrariae TaxID=2071872 RepID=A0ABQ5W6Z0_9HYPH|nr:hypothetical protein [Devosia nitrariae]GLQ55839.1 hypothetical protein GCM10010862_30980 [Devosia nitrariae]
MEDPHRNNTRGRIFLVVLGIIAAIFIIASISSNLAIWRENDAFNAEQQAGEGG